MTDGQYVVVIRQKPIFRGRDGITNTSNCAVHTPPPGWSSTNNTFSRQFETRERENYPLNSGRNIRSTIHISETQTRIYFPARYGTVAPPLPPPHRTAPHRAAPVQFNSVLGQRVDGTWMDTAGYLSISLPRYTTCICKVDPIIDTYV